MVGKKNWATQVATDVRFYRDIIDDPLMCIATISLMETTQRVRALISETIVQAPFTSVVELQKLGLLIKSTIIGDWLPRSQR